MVLKLPLTSFLKSTANFQTGRSLHCSEHRKVLNRSSRCNSSEHTTHFPTRRHTDAAEYLLPLALPYRPGLFTWLQSTSFKEHWTTKCEAQPTARKQTLQRCAWSQQHRGCRGGGFHFGSPFLFCFCTVIRESKCWCLRTHRSLIH